MTLWLVRPPHGFKKYERLNLDVLPCPTILASGDPGAFAYYVENDMQHVAVKASHEKPPYHVPSMEEINAIPWNGYVVASCFSGAGGSCLGYRMAGFRVLWANEFVPIAQASYKVNAALESYLDGRDIRQVQAQDILAQTGLQVGELDLLDGSPPCQAFSTAGKRHKGWGKDKTYEHGARQKNETLFTEYIRLLRGLQPKVFVAENVSGLVKGVAKGFFKEILHELKASGYRVEAKLLDAQWLGVPQMRQRIIFQGVRHDLNRAPAWPKPLPYRYSVREALPWIVRQGDNGGFGAGSMREAGQPSPTIGAGTQAGNVRFPPSLVEAETDISCYATGRAVSVIHDTGGYAAKVPITDRPCPVITIGAGAANSTHYLIAGRGEGVTQTSRRPDGVERRKFTIAELKRICAFPDDFQLAGTYAQQWERLGNSVPPVMMKHIAVTIRDKILQTL